MLASPLNFWKHCPRDNSQKPFGGIRSCLAVRLWLCKRLCLPFPVLVMLIFKIFLVQMVYVVIMAFATQKVSSSRGDARQGRGVVLPISSPKSYSSFFLY